MNRYQEALNCIHSAIKYEPREIIDSNLNENLEHLKLLQELIDKATPKKVVMEAMDGFSAEEASHLVCPCCEKPIVNVWSKVEYKPNYCHYCGQRLDWGDDNESR